MTPVPPPSSDAAAHRGRRAAAFFDLDKTIIATSSAHAFGKEFLHNGLITPTEALQLSLAKASYMLAGHNSEQMEASRDQLAALVAGWSVEEVHSIAVETMHTVVTPAVYAEARQLIEEHRAAGHEVVIVSASASVLVRPIARELGIEHVVATELAAEDGRFTGEVTFFCTGSTKAQAVASMARSLGADLGSCFAYSDSATDIPMLSAVGHPVAVNPDRALRRHAVREGWDVLTFKDPVPLFSLPSAREVGISSAVVVGLAAAVAAGFWMAHHPPARWGRRPR